jgi:hypothetical protein
MTGEASLEALVRGAVESGSWAGLADRVADGFVLRSSSQHGRVELRGPDAVSHLERPGPGTLLGWKADAFPTGLALTFEWRGAGSDGHDRRRWYLRTGDDGRLTALWSYSARPQADAAAQVEVPDAVLAALGAQGTGAGMEHGGNSGAALRRVRVGDEDLVLKRTAPGADWLGRVTDDDGRTGRLWAQGVFAETGDLVDTGIVDAVADGDDWWIAMRDVSPWLVDATRTLTRDEARTVLDAAAGLHARFRGRAPDGCATLEARIGMSGRAVIDAERDGPDLLPKQFGPAWDAFAAVCPPDVADPVLAAVADPGPLARALRDAAPTTLVHGDLRDDNPGFRDGKIVLLDWDLATAGTPTVEFAWFLLQDAWRIDATHDELEADFRAAEPDLDDREVELGMLSGLVQYGWVLGHSAVVHPDPAETAWARAELDWWVPRVRTALERLGGAPG